VDLEFPRGRGEQVKKSWKFQGVGGSHVKPSGTENPGGWGLKLEKTLRGGVWIFFGTTQSMEAISTNVIHLLIKRSLIMMMRKSDKISLS